MASHNLHRQTSYNVLHFPVSSNWAESGLMVQYLAQPGVVVVLMRSRQSLGVQLASAADAAPGSVQQQYHWEQLQFPTSADDKQTNNPAVTCYH